MGYGKPINRFVQRDNAVLFEIVDLKREIPELEKELKVKKARLKKLESK